MSIIPKRRGLFPNQAFAAASLWLALSAAAQAQEVNYPELETMFGEPVTTSVTGKPQRASDSPSALVIITRDDIRRSPAKDIPGLIQAYAGIDVVRWTGAHSDVFVRGGVQPFNPRLLVLVNGRQVYLDYFGMTNWSAVGVQLEEIQQIEIVKGPNGALFGFNAVSGVINIITVNPLHTQEIVSTLEAGTEGHLRLSLSAAIKLKEGLGVRISAGIEKADELDGLDASVLAPKASSVIFSPLRKEIAGELYAKVGEGTTGSVGASYSSSRQLEVLPLLFTAPGYYEFTSLNARISHDTGWGLLSGHLFQNWSDVRQPVTALGLEVTRHNKVFVASADALIRAGTSDRLRFGVEYRANQLETSPGYPGLTRYEVFAASAMWEHQFDDALTLTLAGRLDHLALGRTAPLDQPTVYTRQDFNRSMTEWSLNSALLYRLTERTTLRVSANRGVQAPSLVALSDRIPLRIPGVPVPVVRAGNPALEPAIILSGEVGIIHSFGTNSRLEVNGFYNRTTDITGATGPNTPPTATPPTYPFIFLNMANVGTFEAFGLEASLTGRVSQHFNWDLNYTWTHANQNIVGNDGARFERPLALDAGTPEHKARAQLSYEQGPWLASVAARYTSNIQQLVAPNPLTNRPLTLVPINDSLALDAKLAFKLSPALTFSVAGANLTNSGTAGLSPVPDERRLSAAVQVRF